MGNDYSARKRAKRAAKKKDGSGKLPKESKTKDQTLIIVMTMIK